MKFEQSMSFRCTRPEALVDLLREWDRDQASADVMGYIGTRLLANRDDPGHYMILSEFADVDGELTPAEEAERNNQREATQSWVTKLRALAEAEPEWVHFDELYRTGLTGSIRTG